MQQSTRRRSRALVAAVGVCGAAIATAATTAHGATPAIGSRPGAAGPPQTLTGTRVVARPGTLARGRALPARTIFSTRVFHNAADGFALAHSGQADYPVMTVDGGRRWTVAGPALHVDAANAPAVVTSVGVAGARVAYAYGPSVIDVTRDGGASWYQVFPAGAVGGVVTGLHGLAAYIQTINAKGAVSGTVQYVSSDGGRHWKRSNAFGG